MNRNDWEKQVFASDLCSTARLVALVAGSFGNWTDDKTVWPSAVTMADMAGINRDTAQKYLDAFEEQGWLKHVGYRRNVKEYELCVPTAEPTGTLAKTKKKMNPKSLAQLKQGQANLTAETTGPTAEPTGEVTAETSGESPDRFGKNLKEPKEKNLEENLPVRTGEVINLGIEEASEIFKTDHHSPNLNSKTAAKEWVDQLWGDTA